MTFDEDHVSARVDRRARRRNRAEHLVASVSENAAHAFGFCTDDFFFGFSLVVVSSGSDRVGSGVLRPIR